MITFEGSLNCMKNILKLSTTFIGNKRKEKLSEFTEIEAQDSDEFSSKVFKLYMDSTNTRRHMRIYFFCEIILILCYMQV